MKKCCDNCINKGDTGLNKAQTCDKCVDLNHFDWSCHCCKYKSPEGSGKFCELDDTDGSAACFNGDHFELIPEPDEPNPIEKILYDFRNYVMDEGSGDIREDDIVQYLIKIGVTKPE